MSDFIDGSGEADRHGQARSLAEAALRARREGDHDRAEALMEQAGRVDPQAVEDVLMEAGPEGIDPDEPLLVDPESSDREVERMSRQIEPGADAPSRAGITGSGSGADSQGE